MGLDAPLITSVFFSLYIWCAAADPADPGVFRSKKYLKIPADEKHTRRKDSKLCGESTSSMQDANTVTVVGKLLDKDVLGKEATSKMSTSDSGKKNASETSSCILLACFSPLWLLLYS
ncbi:PREDICTED: probable protein S-acyltransferase 22 isoform X2 [Prunus mume]|nr:PREDICTED: probable protein S-acyltransferase 22 isoform X2 [Prunus mume]